MKKILQSLGLVRKGGDTGEIMKSSKDYVVLDVSGGKMYGGQWFSSLEAEFTTRAFQKKLPFQFDKKYVPRRVNVSGYEARNSAKLQTEVVFDNNSSKIYLTRRSGDKMIKRESLNISDLGPQFTGSFDASVDALIDIIQKFLSGFDFELLKDESKQNTLSLLSINSSPSSLSLSHKPSQTSN